MPTQKEKAEAPPTLQQYESNKAPNVEVRRTPQHGSNGLPSFEEQIRQPPKPSGDDSSSIIMLQEGVSTGSSVLEPNSVLFEDGRTYHGYDAGTYFLPNDGEEQDRLDLQHAMCHLLLKGKFGWAPFETPPREVLDIATGTGIWALEFARQNEKSHVTGTDLSLIQPLPDVPNCEFIRENSETAEWIFPHFFDYIHIRYTMSCFDSPVEVLRKSFNHLEPGGWVELFDPVTDIILRNDPEKKSWQYRWTTLMQRAFTNLGRHPTKARLYKSWLKDLGFVDIREEVLYCPTCPWPEDQRLQQLGRFFRADWKKLLPGTYKLLQAVNVVGEKIEELNEGVRAEIDQEYFQGLIPYYEVYARKPLESEMTATQKANWEAMKLKVASFSDHPPPK